MKKILIAVLFLMVSCSVFAQEASIYSRSGIGIPNYAASVRGMALGEFGIASTERGYLSVLNPASFSYLVATRFELGGSVAGTMWSDGNETDFLTSGSFTGAAFGFPISTTLGLSTLVGLRPYSTLRYDSQVYTRDAVDSTGNYTTEYSGEGGLAQFYFAAAIRLPFNIAFGATLDYYSGQFNYSSDVLFDDVNRFSASFSQIRKGRGFGTTLGLISPVLSAEGWKDFSDWRLGVTFQPGVTLDADSLVSYSSYYTSDTVTEAGTTMKLPMRLIAGTQFLVGGSTQVNIDYMFQPWEDYRFTNASSPDLQNAYKISVGAEYFDRKELQYNREPIRYRASVSYEQTPFKIRGTGISQLTAAVGMSVPLGMDNSVDFSLQYAHRGTTDSGLLSENIIKFGIGISFGEFWFIRQEN